MDNTLVQKISLTIRIDATDLERWKQAATAEGLNLSEWMRRRCASNGVGVTELAEPKRQKLSKLASSLPNTSVGAPELKPGQCPHHKLRGELCYKCDPKFGNPAVG